MVTMEDGEIDVQFVNDQCTFMYVCIHCILLFLLLVFNWVGCSDWVVVGCCIRDRKKMMV
jgi:hypothetical protein